MKEGGDERIEKGEREWRGRRRMSSPYVIIRWGGDGLFPSLSVC